MTTDVERVVQLAFEVSAIRDLLAKKEAELAAISRGPRVARRRGGGAAGRKPGTLTPGSAASRVVEALGKAPKRVFSPAEIAKASNVKLDAVRGVLVRLVASKRVRRAGRGKYRAAA